MSSHQSEHVILFSEVRYNYQDLNFYALALRKNIADKGKEIIHSCIYSYNTLSRFKNILVLCRASLRHMGYWWARGEFPLEWESHESSSLGREWKQPTLQNAWIVKDCQAAVISKGESYSKGAAEVRAASNPVVQFNVGTVKETQSSRRTHSPRPLRKEGAGTWSYMWARESHWGPSTHSHACRYYLSQGEESVHGTWDRSKQA